jgi:hypothetical protein
MKNFLRSTKSNQQMSTKQDLLEAPAYSGSIESVRITKKGKLNEYKPYAPEELTASAKKAFSHSLTMIMGHVADFHTVVLHILSKKYGHSVEEMLEAVMEHPDAKNLTRHPILRDLCPDFVEEDIPKELQTHPNGLYVDEPPAPYHYREAASCQMTAAKDSKKSDSQAANKKAVKNKKSDSQKKTTKSKLEEIFSDSD